MLNQLINHHLLVLLLTAEADAHFIIPQRVEG